MNRDFDTSQAADLVRALLLRVSLSASGTATIDALEAEAVCQLLKSLGEIETAWLEELPDFGYAVAKPLPIILGADKGFADDDLRSDEGADDGVTGDQPLAVGRFGSVGVGTYDGEGADLDFTAYNDPGSDEACLCVDFGTALTKAFATRGWTEAFELPIGRIAGGDHPLMVESSVWIDSGKIYFGPEAVRRSESAGTRARFDSMKAHIMNLATHSGSKPPIVGKDINPEAGTEDFSVLGLVTLYLAYVDQLVGAALSEKGLPAYLKRRIARPCWSGASGDLASRLLKVLVAKSIVVSHTLGSELMGGLDVSQAAEVLDCVDAQLDDEELEELIGKTIETDISEPEAVAAPFDAANDWHYMTVVDVGAGTTDVATFLMRFHPSWDRAKVHLVPGSERSLALAGDHVDAILIEDLLVQARERLNDSQGKEMEEYLRHRIRDLKETLFRDGSLEIELFDVAISMTLADFLDLDKVDDFGASLKSLVADSLSNIPKLHARRMQDKGGVKVLFTGGGSTLPMVTSLTEQPYIAIAGTCVIRARDGDASPEWLIHRTDDFKAIYPQLAVASGGASPDLPERGESL